MPITPRQVLFLEKSPVNSTAFRQSHFYFLSVPEAFYLLIYQLKSPCQRGGNSDNILVKQHACTEVKGLYQSNTMHSSHYSDPDTQTVKRPTVVQEGLGIDTGKIVGVQKACSTLWAEDCLYFS